MTANEQSNDLWNIFQKTLIVIATLAGLYFLYQLREILIAIFVAVILASAMKPGVDGIVQLGLKRVWAILLMYLILLTVIILLALISIPPLIGMSLELFSTGILFDQFRILLKQLSALGWSELSDALPTFVLPEQLQRLLDAASNTAQRQAWPLARDTLLTIGQVILILAMGFYWLTMRKQILDLLLRLSPVSKRDQVATIWNDVEETLGSYVRGQIILMAIIGVAAFIGLSLLGVPYALALAVLSGLMELIPIAGPFLGAIPPILVGFSISPLTGLLVAGWYLIIQVVEGYILIPKIMSQNTGLNSLVVIIAIVAGASLNGVVGALIAIPLAGALQVVARNLLIEPTIESHEPVTAGGLPIIGEIEAEPEQSDEIEIVTTIN